MVAWLSRALDLHVRRVSQIRISRTQRQVAWLELVVLYGELQASRRGRDIQNCQLQAEPDAYTHTKPSSVEPVLNRLVTVAETRIQL